MHSHCLSTSETLTSLVHRPSRKLKQENRIIKNHKIFERKRGEKKNILGELLQLARKHEKMQGIQLLKKHASEPK